MILFDGKRHAEHIADLLRDEIKKKRLDLALAVMQVGEELVITSFIKQKQKFAEIIGLRVHIFSLPNKISQVELESEVRRIGADPSFQGLIIQLPLPSNINIEPVLSSIPLNKDVDLLSSKAFERFEQGYSTILPPVVGAVAEILSSQGIPLKGEAVVLVGKGRLVGKPLAIWLEKEGALVRQCEADSPDLKKIIPHADIVISGVGKSGLIKGEMVRHGAVIIDAGTSEAKGEIKGDVDQESVAQKASLLAPVPGGVGPLTVAMLFKNLVTLATMNQV